MTVEEAKRVLNRVKGAYYSHIPIEEAVRTIVRDEIQKNVHGSSIVGHGPLVIDDDRDLRDGPA